MIKTILVFIFKALIKIIWYIGKQIIGFALIILIITKLTTKKSFKQIF